MIEVDVLVTDDSRRRRDRLLAIASDNTERSRCGMSIRAGADFVDLFWRPSSKSRRHRRCAKL